MMVDLGLDRLFFNWVYFLVNVVLTGVVAVAENVFCELEALVGQQRVSLVE